MFLYAWIALLAFAAPALLQETVILPASTTTVTKSISIEVPAWTVTVPGPTVTLSDCHPTPSASPSAPPGFSCPPDGALVNVLSGSVTLWPCGTPDPTDSVTVLPGESTFTVVPTDESTSVVWVTDTQFVTTTTFPTTASTVTSTFWITTSETVTVVSTTSSSTVLMGTLTVSDRVSGPGSSSEVTSSKAVPSSPPASTSSGVIASSSQSALLSSIHKPSHHSVPHHSSHRSSLTAWSSYGWNSSSTVTRLSTFGNATTASASPVATSRGSGNYTGITGRVTVYPYSASVPPTTRTLTQNVTVILTSVNAPTVRQTSTATVHKTTWVSNMPPPYASAATPTPPAPSMPAICGEGCNSGNFTFDFEENPGSSDATTPFIGIRSPNHHLSFDRGFVYVPPGYDAVRPASGLQLAMFLPNRTTYTPEEVRNGTLRNGGIGAGGNRIINSAFHFNAYSGSFTCNKGPVSVDNGPDPLNCTLQVSGFRWDAAQRQEHLHAISTFDMAPCSNSTVDMEGRCRLTRINFSDDGGDFTDLSSLRVRSYYWIDTAEDRVFFMDDLNLGWTDNSAEADTIRMNGI